MGTSHPHFPCEGTPDHDGSCNEPKQKLRLEGVDLAELREELENSRQFFSGALQRAFDGAAESENENDTVPPAEKSGVYPAVTLETDGEDDPYFNRVSGAV